MTNAEGWFALEEPLVYGDYAMVELSAPNGYWLPDLANTDVVNVPLDENGNPQPWLWSTDPDTGEMVWYVDAYGNSYAPMANVTPFTVAGSGEEYDATKPIIEVEVLVDVFNENQKGYLTLYKEGYVLTGNTTTTGKFGTETKPKWELGGLPNAEYQIYAKTDIITPEGTLRHSAGDLVQNLTTDSKGKLVSEPLYLGEYFVVESKAPYGYILDTTKYDLTLTYQGENVRIFPIAMERFDVRQNVVFKILKQRENAGTGTGATDPNASSWTGANGIIFGLYARNDIMAVDGTTVAIPADALIEQISIANGEGVSGLELPLGKYYVKELETTADLKLDETEYDIEFKFTADDEVYNDEGEYLGMAGTGKGEVVIEIKLGEGVSLKNYLKRGSVEIRKADKDYPTELYLAGAEFTLYDSAGTARAVIVTDDEGKGRADNLPYGQYVMRETKAPEGYKLTAEIWSVNIDADGVVLTYDILDEIDNPQVKVYKKDTSGRSLGGATFEILRAGNADAYLAYKAA
ncbi:MAG: collagen binding domain-containing protein, partial [Oscillospiraceae bacterium]